MSKQDTFENIAVCYAEGFTGMTVMQELALQVSRLPFKEIQAFVDQSRQPEANDIRKMNDLFNVKHYDSSDPESIGDLLNGVDMVLLIPPAQKDKVQCTKFILSSCIQRGVKACVLVSSVGADCTDKPMLNEFHEMEEALKHSGISKTAIVRCGFYMQNLLLYAPQIKKQGILPLPIGEGELCIIDLADIGEGLVKVVQEVSHATDPCHKMYTLTGDTPFTGKKLAQTMAEVFGTKVEWKDISFEEAQNILTESNIIDNYEAKYLLEMYQLVRENRMNLKSDDYSKLLNQKPTEIQGFLQNYRSELITKVETEE